MTDLPTSERKYILRCFQLARMPVHNVSPNPRVGAVLVHQGRIIGEGYHRAYGSPHAEVNAVESVKQSEKSLIKHSTLYVSLEPCFHYGKTPPCVDLIIREKIPRVVVSCLDPNPKVNGKSLTKLRESGVEVITDILTSPGKDLIKPFLFALTKKRPFILLKYAHSTDGFMGKPGKQVWLSNPYTSRLVHKWRSKSSAILCGAETVRTDNPQLTNRYYYGSSPVRILLSSSGEIPVDARIFGGVTKTIIFSPNKPRSEILKNQGIEWLKFSGTVSSFTNLLQTLVKYGIHSLMVEGGAKTLQFFIQAGLWDEARLIESDFHIDKGIPIPNLDGKLISQYHLGNDKISVYVPYNTSYDKS